MISMCCKAGIVVVCTPESGSYYECAKCGLSAHATNGTHARVLRETRSAGMDRAVIDAVRNMLIEHEGFRELPYNCTEGHQTIGYGHNLESRPITRHAAMQILNDDIAWAASAMVLRIPNFTALTRARQAALIDMAFNLGPDGVMKFKKMLAAIAKQDWETAADEMLDSRWSTQVGERAHDLARLMRKGAF